jgi:hypothetical protein
MVPPIRKTKPWAKLRHDELDAVNLDAIIQALTEHSQTCEEARTGIDYFRIIATVCGMWNFALRDCVLPPALSRRSAE